MGNACKSGQMGGEASGGHLPDNPKQDPSFQAQSIPTVSCIVWANCIRFPLYECQAVGVPYLCFSIHRAVSGKVIAAQSGGKGTDKLKSLLSPLRADFKCAGCGLSLTQLCDLAQCA